MCNKKAILHKHAKVRDSDQCSWDKQNTREAPAEITPGEVADIIHIDTISESLPKSYKANMKANSAPIEMEIDTGAAVTIVSEATCEGKLNKPTLKPCQLVLKGYPDNELRLMGRNWLEQMKLNKLLRQMVSPKTTSPN